MSPYLFYFSKMMCLWPQTVGMPVLFVLWVPSIRVLLSPRHNKKIKRYSIIVTDEMSLCHCPTQLSCFLTKCSWSQWKRQRIQWMSNRSNTVKFSWQVLGIINGEKILGFERTNIEICLASISSNSSLDFLPSLSLHLSRWYFPLKWQISMKKKK